MPHDTPTDDFEQAFETLVRAHYQRLGNLAYHYLRSDAAAEDVVQEVLLKAWRRRAFIELADPLPYLYRAVRNECFMVLRRHRRWITTDLDEEPLESPDPPPLDDPATGLAAAAARAVEALPERCRLVYTMHREQDLTYGEIARILGISKKTVENHMGRALKSLREHLAPYLTLVLTTLSLSAR